MQALRRTLPFFGILLICVPAIAQRGARAGGARGADTPNEGRGQAGARLKIEQDLEYARAGGQPLLLDLYHMDPVASARPVVVWIHGSGSGASKASSPAPALINPSGVAVASIEYR